MRLDEIINLYLGSVEVAKAYLGDILVYGASEPVPKSNQVFYWTSNGETTTPQGDWGVNLISNSYESGMGILTFDGDVTIIPSGAFRNNTDIVKVIIPTGVTEIRGGSSSSGAFYHCSNLTSINLPEGLTTIGAYAFVNDGLTSVVLPSTLTTLGSYAFRQCPLSKLVINEGLTSIGNYVFSSSANTFTTLTIPDSVTQIGSRAFQSNGNLAELTIGSGVTSIGTFAFNNCSGLTSIEITAETAPSIASSTFQGVAEGGHLDYPAGADYGTWLSSEPYYLGHYHWNDTEPRLVFTPNTYTALAEGGSVLIYTELRNLNSIEISNGSWYSWDKNTIVEGFDNLTLTVSANYGEARQETIEITNQGVVIATFEVAQQAAGQTGTIIYYHTTDNTPIQPSGTWEAEILVNEVDESGNGRIVFADTITTIPANAFRYGAYSMDSITIPAEITTIKTYAFAGSGLKEIVIPDTVVTMEDNTFRGCSSLEKAYFGSGLTTMKRDRFSANFYQCTSLVYVEMKSVECPAFTGTTVFGGINTTGTFACPIDSEESYQELIAILPPNWNVTFVQNDNEIHYKSRNNSAIQLAQTAGWGANIISNTYYPSKGIGVITFDGNVSSVPASGFTNDTYYWQEIKLPKGITSIGSYAFFELRLDLLEMKSEQCPTVGVYAFYNAHIQRFDYPSNANYLDMFFGGGLSDAIGKLIDIPQIIICSNPNSTQTPSMEGYVGVRGFTRGDEEYLALTFDRQIKKVSGFNYYHFLGGSPTVYLPNSVTEIDYNAFGGSNVESIFGNNVTKLNTSFQGSSLASYRFPRLSRVGYVEFENTQLQEFSANGNYLTNLIDSGDFLKSSAVQRIKLYNHPPTVNDYVFTSIPTGGTLYYDSRYSLPIGYNVLQDTFGWTIQSRNFIEGYQGNLFIFEAVDEVMSIGFNLSAEIPDDYVELTCNGQTFRTDRGSHDYTFTFTGLTVGQRYGVGYDYTSYLTINSLSGAKVLCYMVDEYTGYLGWNISMPDAQMLYHRFNGRSVDRVFYEYEYNNEYEWV